MLGFKIIKEGEYNHLKARNECQKKEIAETQRLYLKEKKDCDSLREQLNEKMIEGNKLRDKLRELKREVKSLSEFRRDTLDAMGKIDLAGFQLSYCTRKCKNCNSKHSDCKKYVFGSHEYCVIPKKPSET